MKVTEAKLLEADTLEQQGAHNPFRRVGSVRAISRELWEKQHGRPMPDDFVHEMVAKQLEPRGGNRRASLGDWKWEDWKDIFRPAKPGELDALEVANGRPRTEYQAEQPMERPKIIPVRLAPLADDVKALLAKVSTESDEAAASAVCGAAAGLSSAKPCTAVEEQACRWFARVPADDASLVHRTKLRPAACPRRIAAELEHAERVKLTARIDRAKLKGIPAKYIREIIVEGRKDKRPCLEAVREWYPTPLRYLALCADNGEGKTFSACTWLEAMPDGFFIECSTLHDAIRPGPDDAPEKLARAAARRARYVVIDNLESHLTQALRAEIDEIYVRAGNRDGRVLLTASMTGVELREVLTVQGAKNGAALSRLTMYGRIAEISTGGGE